MDNSPILRFIGEKEFFSYKQNLNTGKIPDTDYIPFPKGFDYKKKVFKIREPRKKIISPGIVDNELNWKG